MKIVTRYLAHEVYAAMLATIVVLLFIFLSNQLVRFMHSAAIGMLSEQTIKTLLLLQVPILLAILLPAGLFLGILIAYGRLYADSEMIIFAACGINPRHLLTTTINFSAVIMVIVAILSLWINPKIYKYSDYIKSGVTATSFAMVKPNHFNEIEKSGWVFYVESVSEDKTHFYNVFAAKQPEPGETIADSNLSMVTAKSAYQKVDPKTHDLYLMLIDGYRYIGTPGQKDYEVIKYDEYGLQITHDTKGWQGDASSMPTLKLWQMRQDKLAAAELQWRISLPLSALILTLVGTPLSRIKPKHGRYAKLVPAILLYIIYANFLFLAKAWIRKGVLIPELGMWWVHGLMLMLAIYLLGQQIGWWRNRGK